MREKDRKKWQRQREKGVHEWQEDREIEIKAKRD